MTRLNGFRLFDFCLSRKTVSLSRVRTVLVITKMLFKVRLAAKEDCKDISRMITEFADFEKLSDQVKITHEELERDGFCQNPFFECLVAEVPEEHKSKEGFTVVGYALYFYIYTWGGRSVYLEDLYVMEEFRGKGIGNSLLSKVAEVGKKKQCVRLHLTVLDWNTPARDFYAAKGAQDLTASLGRHLLRFSGRDLDNLAN